MDEGPIPVRDTWFCRKEKNNNVSVSSYKCVLTRVWLSTKVTSAQKLEMDMAMVFPLKPSEGFPIIPTLPVATQSKDHNVRRGSELKFKCSWSPTWHKSDTWSVWQDGPVAWWSSGWATWCSQGGPDMLEESLELDGVFTFQQWQHAALITCKDFYPAMQQTLLFTIICLFFYELTFNNLDVVA